MKPLLNYLTLGLLSLFCTLVAAKPSLQPDKDYKIIAASQAPLENKQVLEFLNYYCAACYRLEPFMQQWLAKKPRGVAFIRVPVVFHSGWDSYAKAYYIIQSLGLESTVGAKLFAALHTEQLQLSNTQQLADFVAKQGVEKQQWLTAYESSPAIDIKLKQGSALMQQYNIMAVPAFVVNGRYYTDMALLQGDPQRLLQTLDFLIAQTTIANR
jgi:thiol:disulfide interchange protein DsbA